MSFVSTSSFNVISCNFDPDFSDAASAALGETFDLTPREQKYSCATHFLANGSHVQRMHRDASRAFVEIPVTSNTSQRLRRAVRWQDQYEFTDILVISATPIWTHLSNDENGYTSRRSILDAAMPRRTGAIEIASSGAPEILTTPSSLRRQF